MKNETQTIIEGQEMRAQFYNEWVEALRAGDTAAAKSAFGAFRMIDAVLEMVDGIPSPRCNWDQVAWEVTHA